MVGQQEQGLARLQAIEGPQDGPMPIGWGKVPNVDCNHFASERGTGRRRTGRHTSKVTLRKVTSCSRRGRPNPAARQAAQALAGAER